MKKILPFLLLLVLLGCEKASSDSAAFGGAIGSNTGQGGSTARFTIAGNFLYTVDKENLHVFDITDPAAPVFKVSIGVGFAIETIFPFKDKLFIGSTSVVHIFSLDDPAKPVKIGQAISPDVLRRCDPVVAKDSVAFATLRSNGSCGGTTSILAVYDIHDATKPIEKAQVSLQEPYGLGYSGNTLYVCDRFMGLVVFDITKPFQPTIVKQVQIQGLSLVDVIPVGTTLVAWSSTGMVLFDISNPQNPVLIKQIN